MIECYQLNRSRFNGYDNVFYLNMENSTKLKIKEAKNCIDCPSNKERILERLSSMAEEILSVRKEIQIKDDLDKVKEEESLEYMAQSGYSMKKEEWEEMKRKLGCIIKKKKKENDGPVLQLEEKIHEMRIKNLVNNFIKKVSRNNSERTPVDFSPFKEKNQNSGDLSGFQIPNILLNIFYFISIINTFAMIVIFSMSVLFEEALKSEGVTGVQAWATAWLLIEMGVNFVKVSYGKGYHKMEKLREIAEFYFRGKFAIDFACWLGLVLDLCFNSQLTLIARLVFMLKSWDCLTKIQALETKFINTSYKENCWGLVKIFLTNFIIAHFLAVILIMISWLNTKQNWLSKVNAMQAPWIQQYCWAYYWGTTIMFTVGFGDISAVNHQEAMFIVIIQAFTCIYSAYNITCVGAYITSIHAEDVEKQKKQKTLKHLSDKNNISKDLTVKINNYIEECANIKKNFNIEQDAAFISNLPPSIKTSFLRQSNKKIFENLPFFSTLTESTLLQLAEKIEMSITHPEQIIEKKDEKPRILILQKGSVAFCSKMSGADYNNSVVDKIQTAEGEKPILLSLEFINPIKVKNYELHSKEYSVLYTMEIEDFKVILKSKDRDFEHYCYLKDKSKHVVDEFQFLDCEYCPSKHLKFRCSKLHYMPFVQEVIYKHLKRKTENKRLKLKRGKAKKNAFAFKKFNQKLFSPNSQSSISEELSKENQQSKQNLSLQEMFSLSNISTASRRRRSETRLIEDAVSCLKKQLMVFLNEQHNWFWEVESDILKNYQHYFIESNPKNWEEGNGGEKKNYKKNKKDMVQFWK